MSPYLYRSKGLYWGSEVFDLIISWVILSFSFAVAMRPDLRLLHVSLLYSSVGVGTAFLLHELAHREVARTYELTARYRAWYLGLMVTLAVALLNVVVRLPILFAAPGAVVIYGYWGRVDPRAELRIAESGPLMNIALSIATWLLLNVMPAGALAARELIYYVARINAWLAFFNLLPLPPLDGFKIFRRSLIEWLVIFVVSVVTLRLLIV